MKANVSRLVLATVLSCVASSFAFAQGGGTTGSIGGTVSDSGGGVIPGATAVVLNIATSVSNTVVTNSSGVFIVPALQPGNYTVTVTLQGFKTAKYDRVNLQAGGTVQLKVVLEIGAMSETKEVVATTELVKTADNKVEATISADQINNLPLVTKNALNFVTFLPGVNSGSTHSQRASTILGLPQSTIAITIDGVNVQDQGLHSSDGFFAVIRPQTDLVEEVTVTEATPGADSSANGAVQIKFVTRSGSNQSSGSVYEYLRHPSLNSNTFFSTPAGGTLTVENPKNVIILNQYGIRQGGPIVFPGLYDGHGKAFYFINYEEMRLPSSITRTRTVLNPNDMTGNFLYSCAGTTGNSTCARSVNILTLAASKGFQSTTDPTTVAMLSEITAELNNCAVCLAGAKFNTDQNTFGYTFNSPSTRIEHLPGGRADFNLSSKERLSATYEFQKVNSNPDILNSRDPSFLGGTTHGSQFSFRNSGSATLRSTLTANIVNEAGWGFQWAPVHFFTDMTSDLWLNSMPNVPGFSSLPGSQGYRVVLPLVTSAQISANVQERNGSDWTAHDTLTWLKGAHSVSGGVNFTQTSLWNEGHNVVPSISLSVDTVNDPVASMFTTANFPGATSTELGSARNLYALLVGRVTQVSQVSAQQADGSFIYGGIPLEKVRQKEVGMFAQDQWRVRPNLTLNLGVRYELQFPTYPLTGLYGTNVPSDICGQSGFGTPASDATQAQRIGIQCNFGNPGVLNALGQIPTYKHYTSGQGGYNLDKNNVAPSLGVAWQPNAQHGFLRSMLGDPALATVRASYARSFNQGGLFDYTGPFENAPGLSVDSTRNFSNGNLVIPTSLSPSLTAGALGPPGTCGAVLSGCIPTSLTYPESIVFTPNGTWLFDPNFQTSYTDSYSVGFQRAVNRDTAVEVRYVGTRNKFGASYQEFGEMDILNNGFGASSSFLQEFKNAQQNLAVNVANGKGATYAFNNLPGQNPLPIMLASFNGSTGCGATTFAAGCPGASDPTKYVQGSNSTNPWTNTGFVQSLSLLTPNIFQFTGLNTSTSLFGVTAFRNNGLAAGLPINFWVMNPDVLFNGVQSSVTFTKYNSVQLILTRRLSHGLQVSANYAWQVQYNSQNEGSVYRPYHLVRSTGTIPNAFKFTANWDIPVGRGKRFGTDMNTWINGLIGNWNVAMTGRVENGRLIDLGDVVLGGGLTRSALQSEFKYYRGADGFWYDMPQALIQNTAKAFATDATTTTGYVACTGSNSFNCGGPDTTQPFIGPSSSASCTRVYQGDCTTRDQFIIAPIFTRFDFTAKKRFPFAKHGSFDVEIDILNIFNAIDFNSVYSNGTSLGNYQVTSAYSDVNNTFDPGGRIGQLVFRVNW